MASDNSVDLLEHLGNDLFNNHPDFMRQALGAMLAQFMEAEITQRTGAAPGERTEDRLAVRNGYRSRPLETRMGTLELAIPNCAAAQATCPPSSSPGSAGRRPSSASWPRRTSTVSRPARSRSSSRPWAPRA